jgi:hypothetical protein
MRRALLAALACASALSVAPAAEAKVCVGRQILEGWTGACALGDGWVVCVRDARMYPALEVYLPRSSGDPCRPS